MFGENVENVEATVMFGPGVEGETRLLAIRTNLQSVEINSLILKKVLTRR